MWPQDSALQCDGSLSVSHPVRDIQTQWQKLKKLSSRVTVDQGQAKDWALGFEAWDSPCAKNDLSPLPICLQSKWSKIHRWQKPTHWGDGSVSRHLPRKREDLSLDPQYHIKARQKGGEEKVPEACWQDSVAKLLSSKLEKTPDDDNRQSRTYTSM